jgi:hypothetical protein
MIETRGQRALRILGSEDLGDHAAHRGADHVCAIDAQHVEQANRIGSHVVQQIGRVELLAFHQLGKGAHQVG